MLDMFAVHLLGPDLGLSERLLLSRDARPRTFGGRFFAAVAVLGGTLAEQTVSDLFGRAVVRDMRRNADDRRILLLAIALRLFLRLARKRFGDCGFPHRYALSVGFDNQDR